MKLANSSMDVSHEATRKRKQPANERNPERIPEIGSNNETPRIQLGLRLRFSTSKLQFSSTSN